jgi:hypothetical protein
MAAILLYPFEYWTQLICSGIQIQQDGGQKWLSSDLKTGPFNFE